MYWSSLLSFNFVICRSLVFGGFDGIMASLIIISAAAGEASRAWTLFHFYPPYNHILILAPYTYHVTGASLSWRVVVVLGVASVLANSISTGVSEYLSSKAHRAFIQAEKRRGLWEFKNYKEVEMFEVSVRCMYIYICMDALLDFYMQHYYLINLIVVCLTDGKSIWIPRNGSKRRRTCRR